MEINNEHLHWQVSVDKHSNIYFGSERNGSKGRDDIFVAEYQEGSYNAPVSMAKEINSPEHESTPFISPDGDYIIFGRDGLWISFKDEFNQWSKATFMGEALSGICPYVSPDGKYLFFLRMGMGYNDIYWVSGNILNELKRNIK